MYSGVRRGFPPGEELFIGLISNKEYNGGSLSPVKYFIF